MFIKVVVCWRAEEYERKSADGIQSPHRRLLGTTANRKDQRHTAMCKSAVVQVEKRCFGALWYIVEYIDS